MANGEKQPPVHECVQVMLTVLLLLTPSVVVSWSDEHNKCDCSCEEPSKLWKYGVPVAGGVAAVLAAPYAVAAAGFGAAGVGVGTVAAKMMSLAATTGYGAGVISTLQGIGAAGMTAAGYVTTGTVGAGTAKAASWLFGSETDDCCCKK